MLDRLYIGQTGDFEKRFQEHLGGVSFYTKRTKDWKLIYKEEFQIRSAAMRREKELKSHKGRDFLRSKLKGG